MMDMALGLHDTGSSQSALPALSTHSHLQIEDLYLAGMNNIRND